MATRTETLAVKLLESDVRVQRTIDNKRVNGIIADFNRAALGVPVVNHRKDRSYHVIDGQHRVEALKAMDMLDEKIECLVYEGLSLAEEAMLFRQLNNTRQVQPIDRFRIRVVEGDPVACQINDLLNAYGWKITTGQRASGGFAAVSAAERVYRGPKGIEQNLGLLRDTIDIIVKSWGMDQSGAKAEILRGIAAVLKEYGDKVDKAKLIRELSKYGGGPRRLLGVARGLRDMRGGSVSDAMSETVITIINKGKQNKLPTWRGGA